MFGHYLTCFLLIDIVNRRRRPPGLGAAYIGAALGHISKRPRYKTATKHPIGAPQRGIRAAGRNQRPVDVKTTAPHDIVIQP